MANFNNKKVNSRLTRNVAGGLAYKESSKYELVSLLLTSFLSGDKYYESNNSVKNRLSELAAQLLKEDKLFLAKASLYARDKYRMRSVSHLVSATILEDVVKDNWSESEKKPLENYLSRVIMRPDDITETIACYSSLEGAYHNSKGRVQLPNVAKRGFSRAMADYDEYRMAKYKGSDKEISLLDAVRMVRPKSTGRNRSALNKLVKGVLKSTTTWEATQSKAGQAGSKEEVVSAKKAAWSEFLDKGDKIEYFALLRNLRNILSQCSAEDINRACSLIENEKLIKNSKVLPFRFLSASISLQSADIGVVPRNKARRSLNRAMEIALSNVPKLDGTTAILLDISGSMNCSLSSDSSVSVRGIANLFAAALYKANDSTVILFNHKATVLDANPSDSLVTIASQIPCDGGTDMSAAFRALGDEKYDNIIVLSDMQTYLDGYFNVGSKTAFNNYKKISGASNCKLFSFDLQGNGTLQFPEENVFLLSGWSEHSFEIMSKMAEDKQYLIHEIESIEL